MNAVSAQYTQPGLLLPGVGVGVGSKAAFSSVIGSL